MSPLEKQLAASLELIQLRKQKEVLEDLAMRIDVMKTMVLGPPGLVKFLAETDQKIQAALALAEVSDG